MKNKTKLILIIIGLIVIAGVIYSNLGSSGSDASYETLANTSIGTVEKCVYGNENAPKCIALITGIHPREPLSIEPEIKAAQQYENDDVKIIHYKVTVTDRPTDYNAGRANGESLVHDYVNPDVTKSDAGAVIISHSHMAGYGQGFYLATPEMDDASVKIATDINKTSDFNYYPVTGNESYKSTSAVLVSKPIAQAGYPTFVYEIPEDITNQTSTDKAIELFNLISKYI
ncbi:hypothetical protein [Methanobrevibacter sp.]|uniref:hypothetical protein n=1 Tax=Methanobrevibacter sp. TaxID=66852 RepID=UPI0025EDC14C|nr:hypothetical protein [Methanobrevibacter sp.]MBQ6512242.1 hypothetical protein [Methanobrevibacter sp.]